MNDYNNSFGMLKYGKICLISPGTDLPGEWALLALGSVPGLLRQTLHMPSLNILVSVRYMFQ